MISIESQLELISTIDKRINAFITVDEPAVLAECQQLKGLTASDARPLCGFSLAIKDNIEVAGLPNTAGTASLREFYPQQDATAIKRVKAAGAIIIGKANMHELAYGITSNHYAYGAVGNVHNPDYFAGGSSGGTAATIAAGLAHAGLGTDTGGSCRIPAALNGIVGFRPTVGRYPNDGVVLISNTRDTIGPMGLNVADVALLDAVLSDASSVMPVAEIAPHSLRLGVPRSYFYDDLEPAVSAVMEDTLSRFKNAGITLIESDLIGVAELNAKVSFPIVLYETAQLLPKYLSSNNIPLNMETLCVQIASPDVQEIMHSVMAADIPEPVYQEALQVFRPQLQQAYVNYFQRHAVDAVILPTTPLSARPIAGSDATVTLNGKQVPTFATYIRNVDPSSSVGIPGLTIPVGKDKSGLPIGLEIEGMANSDRKLLAIGQLLESILANAKN